jgi:iron complex transport system permease protein
MKKNFILLLVFLVLLIGLSTFIGRYSFFVRMEYFNNSLIQKLITKIRIPRILTAVLAGVALSLSGFVLQIVFRNPLADPGVIGVSQAAGFGAAFAILFFRSSSFYIQFFAFLFSLIALILTFTIAKRIKTRDILAVILSGVAVSAFFSAALGLLKYLADPIDQLPNIVFWLLGSFANASWQYFFALLSITLPIIILLWLYRWRLNIHGLEDEISFSLGLNPKFEKYILVGCAVLLTSSVIAFTGIIGWVGLIVPNLSRILLGQNTLESLPYSAVLGAIFLLISDNLARLILPGEIPIGIITAFLGASFFVIILINRKLD